MATSRPTSLSKICQRTVVEFLDSESINHLDDDLTGKREVSINTRLSVPNVCGSQAVTSDADKGTIGRFIFVDQK